MGNHLPHTYFASLYQFQCCGIILASPVYYGSATALIKALMERVPGIFPTWVGRFSKVR
jgi:hypothetical protein